jgi:hypothetical protein
MRTLLPLLALAACAGSSPADDLAGRTAGPAEDCVPTSTGAGLVARDSRTLVYRQGATLWVNRLAAACPGIHPLSTLIVDVQGGQYCRGDRVRGVEPGQSIPGPACLLGPFTPWRR